jgi:hypothetical protein
LTHNSLFYIFLIPKQVFVKFALLMTLPTFMMAIVKGTYSLRPLEALLRIEPALILPSPFGSSLIALGTNCRPAKDE